MDKPEWVAQATEEERERARRWDVRNEGVYGADPADKEEENGKK
jgi:hypothetical protein